MEIAVEQEISINPAVYETMLATIRKRRLFLWGVILVYLPAALTTLQWTQSYTLIGILFLAWLASLCIAVALVACAKCPACGNNFHMRNSALSFLPRCCHCGVGARAASPVRPGA